MIEKERKANSNRKNTISLAEADIGSIFYVHSIEGNAVECHRLRELGFCEKAEVVKIAHGAMTVCLVCGSKVGLNKLLAKRIFVTSAKKDSAI
ncbi:iron transporter [Methylacidiphilum sp. Yel]|jgi:Fe2+ transport system protein FeoA|uniref:FeoA family protein n=1 Tax=Methylacidiphilum sp. Yel TaxID=1847730 RepID=UPI00106C506C|nr:FeoA family protein [Methylacidiphilum sp. Yel]TFE67509.1 iron transporter [Methylacidiphilum sp. Yel]